MTHLGPGNTGAWYSAAAQHLNPDCDGGPATGSATGHTLYDSTANLDQELWSDYLSCCNTYLFGGTTHSEARSPSLKKCACCDKIWKRLMSSWRDLSSRRSQSFCSIYKAASASGNILFIAFVCCFPKHIRKLFLPKRMRAAEAMTFLIENVFSYDYNNTSIQCIVSKRETKQSVLVIDSFHIWQLK